MITIEPHNARLAAWDGPEGREYGIVIPVGGTQWRVVCDILPLRRMVGLDIELQFHEDGRDDMQMAITDALERGALQMVNMRSVPAAEVAA